MTIGELATSTASARSASTTAAPSWTAPAPSWRTGIDEAGCRTFQGTLELVGRRWTGAILLAGSRGARRFGEYRTAVHGISDRLLAQRLRELAADGLVARTVIPSTPVQVRYSLTPDGTELLAALQPLLDWSNRRRDR